MKIKFLTILATMALATAAFAGSMKDPRDGKTYRTVQIGNQTWMAENLNFASKQSKCYDNKEINCDKYGRLYVWSEKMVASVCPSGWHLPSKGEFETLLRNVGGERTAGTALKSRGGWNVLNRKNGNGRDEYGFGALPAGFYFSDDDSFFGGGGSALFWSSTENGSNIAYFLCLRYNAEYAYVGNLNKDYGFSVRCVKNSN